METSRQDALSDGEGAKGGKQPAKLPPPPCNKKASKKKKKKKSVPDKHSSQAKKKSLFAIFPLDLLQRWKCDGTPTGRSRQARVRQSQELALCLLLDHFRILPRRHCPCPTRVFAGTAFWTTPEAEEERLSNYRLSRRKRYDEFLQQNPLLDLPFSCQQLPDLDKVTEADKERSLHKSKSSLMTAKNKKASKFKAGQQNPKETADAVALQ
ncbi:protein LIAT1 [Erythrolamprus reginae]|uniref:protein LIAT1 n=1 Tax=Erythrolamprus reginae TaxID=121349 RepID=UPI00396CC2DF